MALYNIKAEPWMRKKKKGGELANSSRLLKKHKHKRERMKMKSNMDYVPHYNRFQAWEY